MSKIPKYGNKVGMGGFIPSNIQRALVKDILESGDPESYWYNLYGIFEDLEYYIEKHPDTWQDDLLAVLGDTCQPTEKEGEG